ncbi:hypothetical protein CH302_19210 [Rhodococcus sp. 15-2388-1-1a]|uniref:hypothetical protein n=1 Tax=Nocardiaceae TaxID=85025 RepID=UPI0005674FC7|nr:MULTISPECIES: hypothetical protein [Rhodococcus]OZE95071.1 hypothetical protein CH302_19210 [Rhodococcus sp. 15-2388-1-1a]
MGHRKSHYAIVRLPYDGGQSPNRTVPQITCEIRVFHPPAAELDDITGAIDEALAEVLNSVTDRTAR